MSSYYCHIDLGYDITLCLAIKIDTVKIIFTRYTTIFMKFHLYIFIRHFVFACITENISHFMTKITKAFCQELNSNTLISGEQREIPASGKIPNIDRIA